METIILCRVTLGFYCGYMGIIRSRLGQVGSVGSIESRQNQIAHIKRPQKQGLGLSV